MTTSKVVFSSKVAKAIYITMVVYFIIWMILDYNCNSNINSAVGFINSFGFILFFWICFLSFVLTSFFAVIITVLKCQIDVSIKGKSWDDILHNFGNDSKKYFYKVWAILAVIVATAGLSYSLIVFISNSCSKQLSY